jgi:hypothetical protein
MTVAEVYVTETKDSVKFIMMSGNTFETLIRDVKLFRRTSEKTVITFVKNGRTFKC